jgi:hypothetical protein
MPKLIDLTQQKFNRLTIIKRLNNNQYGSSRWLCECNCGQETIVLGSDLTGGKTQSCGCLRIKHGHTAKFKKSKTYISWYHMIQRCTNPNNKDYHDYGERKITVCRQWLKFENFLADMGEVPDSLQIDRINNNKGYYKENCRWTTSKINNRNRRSNHLISYNNKTQCVMEWSEEIGIPEYVIRQRLKHDWSIQRTLITPVRKRKKTKRNK